MASERYDDSWRREHVGRGDLPPRYLQPWAARFEELVLRGLEPGSAVLDVGSGRNPALVPHARPHLRYVGLDVSRSELQLAPTGAYDHLEIASVTDRQPHLDGQFDLVLSYQVFEHVAPLERALENIGRYLRPGGSLVALFSGRYSPMALINRAMPHRWAQRLNSRLVGREPDSMFEAGYDKCYASAVRALLDGWRVVELEPRWEAASYFAFSKPVLRAYIAVENRLASGRWEDLATHYFLRAVR